MKWHFATRPKKYVEWALEIEFVMIEMTILIGHVCVDIGNAAKAGTGGPPANVNKGSCGGEGGVAALLVMMWW